jgi:hypothetical protein
MVVTVSTLTHPFVCSFNQGETTMLNNHEFAMEPLEDRLELLYCYWQSYVGLCSINVGFFKIYYPCLKWRLVCYW